MDYDVIVVGAGPSGSSCAAFLGRRGIKTLLVDKASFPRDKACGDGITGKSLQVLKELGISNKLELCQYMVIKSVSVSCSGVDEFRVAHADNTQNIGYGCKRQIFDNVIFGLAKEHADVLENFTVTDVIMENGKVSGIKGVAKNGEEKEFRTKVVVGADGANSVVAKRLGAGGFKADKSYVAARAYYEGVNIAGNNLEIHLPDELLPGYFWIFPVGDNVFNVGLGVMADEVQKRKLNLKTMMEYMIKKSYLSEKFKNARQVSEIKGWNLPTGAQKRRRAGDGFLLVGDAASLIDPFTGEGIGNALTSGKLAAGVICDAVKRGDFSYKTLRNYEVEINRKMGKGFRMQQLAVWIMKSKLLFRALMRELSENTKDSKLVFSSFIAITGTLPGVSIKFYLRLLLRIASELVNGGRREPIWARLKSGKK